MPAACPKCGMALESAVPLDEQGPNPELADMQRRLRWSAVLTVPIVALAMLGASLVLAPRLIRRTGPAGVAQNG